MAYTVNSSFEDFMRDSVNLDPDRTTTARTSRDWLVQKIEDLVNRGKLPPLHDGVSHYFFGSFARNTKIRQSVSSLLPTPGRALSRLSLPRKDTVPSSFLTTAAAVSQCLLL